MEFRKRGNLISYLKDEQVGFETRSLRDADLLALAALTHLTFESVPELEDLLPLNLRLLSELPQCTRLAEDPYLGPFAAQVLELAGSSARLGAVTLEHVSTLIDRNEVLQFGACAFTVPAPEPLVVVAFRGTGNELTGWHEDFDLVLQDEVPAQREARRFFDQVATDNPNASFVLTGHSKGGMLAEYAALFGADGARDHIAKTVSFDGPGIFKMGSAVCPEFESRDATTAARYAQAQFPMVRYMFASFVGLMLEPRPLELFRYCEMLPREFPHAMTAPVIRDGEFVLRVPDTDELVRATALNRWVEQLSMDDRRLVIDAIFEEYQEQNETLEFTKLADLFAWASMLVRYQMRVDASERLRLGRIIGLLARELAR